jgi:hypothetical protein
MLQGLALGVQEVRQGIKRHCERVRFRQVGITAVKQKSHHSYSLIMVKLLASPPNLLLLCQICNSQITDFNYICVFIQHAIGSVLTISKILHIVIVSTLLVRVLIYSCTPLIEG